MTSTDLTLEMQYIYFLSFLFAAHLTLPSLFSHFLFLKIKLGKIDIFSKKKTIDFQKEIDFNIMKKEMENCEFQLK